MTAQQSIEQLQAQLPDPVQCAALYRTMDWAPDGILLFPLVWLARLLAKATRRLPSCVLVVVTARQVFLFSVKRVGGDRWGNAMEYAAWDRAHLDVKAVTNKSYSLQLHAAGQPPVALFPVGITPEIIAVSGALVPGSS
jgi:hypothetical protein